MTEERAVYSSFGEGFMAGIKPVLKITNLEQVAIYRALLALLKRLEWSQRQQDWECCPVCYGYKEVRFHIAGHLDKCELGQLIQVLEMILEKPA